MNKLIFLICLYVLSACASQRKLEHVNQPSANEPFIIYKTKADYSNLVPIILNDARDAIVSFPAPSDLKIDNALRIPTKLHDGYLLDNKGIGKNVAFTTYTYQQYAERSAAPSVDDLMKHIKDKDPLLELYDCKSYIGIKYDIRKVNKLVKTDFEGCVKVK